MKIVVEYEFEHLGGVELPPDQLKDFARAYLRDHVVKRFNERVQVQQLAVDLSGKPIPGSGELGEYRVKAVRVGDPVPTLRVHLGKPKG